jgi:type II secretory pathway component PulF
MFPSPQLSNKQLAELCHRLAIEADAGIDIRRTWQREASTARGRLQPSFAQVREAVAQGDSLTAALTRAGREFPLLFREMAEVGEQTGTLGKVFHRLEAHYRRQVQAQRIFLGAIAWPMIELALAILVIGVLIYVLGVVAARGGGKAVDVLGFGLVGSRGLFIYVNFLIVVGLCITGLVIAMRRGVLWVRPVQRALMRLPGIGASLEKLALARLAWALHLTLNVEMDLRRVVPLALRATGSDHYIRHTNQIVAEIAAGEPLYAAFARSRAFPATFIDALAVAEESGQTVESMDRLAKRYEEEAEVAVKALATILGVLVGMLVMGIIILLIFRLAGFYFGTINDALKMMD